METLLTADLFNGSAGTAFGFEDPPGGNLFNFLFKVTVGNPDVLADGFNQLYGGVNLNAWFQSSEGDTPFNGTWTGSFNNSGSYLDGISDVSAFLVPEPSSILLSSLGIALCMAAYRRRLNKAGRPEQS